MQLKNRNIFTLIVKQKKGPKVVNKKGYDYGYFLRSYY